jgi:hypothetical protein
MNPYFSRLLLFLSLFISVFTFAQTQANLNIQNFANAKVDDLTDEQVLAFWNQAQEKGLSLTQLQHIANQRNMNLQEFAKLKLRIQNLTQSSNKIKKEESSSNREYFGYENAEENLEEGKNVDSEKEKNYKNANKDRKSRKKYLVPICSTTKC